MMRTRPVTNEKFVKLWRYFVAYEISEKVSGPATDKSTIFFEGDIQPQISQRLPVNVQ
jgi:hypothetical protein